MVKAVFFDVDGTLVSHTHNAVPESTRISLNKLHEGGIQRVIATGRHLNELSRMPVKGISFDAYMRNPTQSTAVSIKTLSLIECNDRILLAFFCFHQSFAKAAHWFVSSSALQIFFNAVIL